MSEHTKEQFSEQVSNLREYAYEAGHDAYDDRARELMIESQISIHKLYDDAQAEITRLKDANNDLVKALSHTKSSLEMANLVGVISDTIWASGKETLFDYIDVALAKAKGME